MNNDPELAEALNKTAIALKAIGERMELFEKCLGELIKAVEILQVLQLKPSELIIDLQSVPKQNELKEYLIEIASKIKGNESIDFLFREGYLSAINRISIKFNLKI